MKNHCTLLFSKMYCFETNNKRSTSHYPKQASSKETSDKTRPLFWSSISYKVLKVLFSEQNGTRVEIQQDNRRQFRATFIECENTERTECHGIDNSLFTSECVTLYEFRPAGVRIVGNPGDFVEGLIKVPITCQCRLRRKFNRPWSLFSVLEFNKARVLEVSRKFWMFVSGQFRTKLCFNIFWSQKF